MPTISRGSRRDFAALETRRVEAATDVRARASQAAVARGLGVPSAAANHWHQAWAAEGRLGLKAAGPSPPKGCAPYPDRPDADIQWLMSALEECLILDAETASDAREAPQNGFSSNLEKD